MTYLAVSEEFVKTFEEIKMRLQKLEESYEIMAKRVFGFDKPAKQSKWEVGGRVRVYDSLFDMHGQTGTIRCTHSHGYGVYALEVHFDHGNGKGKFYVQQCRRLKKKNVSSR